jgi:hypothetical protein
MLRSRLNCNGHSDARLNLPTPGTISRLYYEDEGQKQSAGSVPVAYSLPTGQETEKLK